MDVLRVNLCAAVDAVGEKAAVRKTRQLIVERLEPKLFQRVVERPPAGVRTGETRPVEAATRRAPRESRNRTRSMRLRSNPG